MRRARAAPWVAWLGCAALTTGAIAAEAGQRAASPAGACEGEGPAPGPGSLEPFQRTREEALALNAAGKAPYRQGKWEEARVQYRGALAADPQFLAPRLNIACSFVREERFAEAIREVIALLDGAYVPWAREIREAADLGALKVRPEWKEIERAMAASASRWGDGLDASVLFVARRSSTLRVPDGPGVFLLNPSQEVWAYSPRTRRYRQLTAEDGHVVALVRSADNRRALYVTAEKLVRGDKPGNLALREVAFHELTLATMNTVSSEKVAGDVRRVQLSPSMAITLDGERRTGTYRLDPLGALVPANKDRTDERTVVLTGRGVEARPSLWRREGSCGVEVREGSLDNMAPNIAVGHRPLKEGAWYRSNGFSLP